MNRERTGTQRRAFDDSDARRASKADQVYEELKEQILSGALEPGASIDKVALCERLNVSRFPVTAAINRLAYEKLVTIEPQHGSFVAKISAADVREFMLIRRAIENEIVGQAADHMPKSALEALSRNLRYQQAAAEAGDSSGFYTLDVDFHRLIAQALGFKRASEILDGLRAHLERARRLTLNSAWATAAIPGRASPPRRSHRGARRQGGQGQPGWAPVPYDADVRGDRRTKAGLLPIVNGTARPLP